MSKKIGAFALLGVLGSTSTTWACGPVFPPVLVMPAVAILLHLPILLGFTVLGSLVALLGRREVRRYRFQAIRRMILQYVGVFLPAAIVFTVLVALVTGPLDGDGFLGVVATVVLLVSSCLAAWGPLILTPLTSLSIWDRGGRFRPRVVLMPRSIGWALLLGLGFGLIVVAGEWGGSLEVVRGLLVVLAIAILPALADSIDERAGLATVGRRRRPEAAPVELVRISSRPANCPVCRRTVGTRSWSCDRCESRQHPECHEYLGTCATYGCSLRAAAPVPGK